MHRRQTLGVLDSNSLSAHGKGGSSAGKPTWNSSQPGSSRLSLGGSGPGHSAGIAFGSGSGSVGRANGRGRSIGGLSSDFGGMSLSQPSFGGPQSTGKHAPAASGMGVGSGGAGAASRRSSAHRMSMAGAGNGGGNAPSVLSGSMGGGGASLVGKDPRMIRDKGWQTHAIRTILKFLMETGYDKGGVSSKTLQQPTQKEFQNIFTFIYGHLDPGHEFTKKMEEEIPPLLKFLRYPFADQITKHTLMTVGSMHAWPQLLSMLVWMVELILCCDHIHNELEDSAEVSSHEDPETTFSNWVLTAYKMYFMMGNDDVGELREAVELLFQAKDQSIAESCHRAQRSIDALVDEVGKLKRDESPIVTLERERATLHGDLSKYHEYLGHLEAKRQKHEESVREQKSLLSDLSAQASDLKADNALLQAQIDAQLISAADVERINGERDKLHRSLESLRARAEETANRVWEREMSLQKIIDATEAAVQTFNALVYKLRQQATEAGSSAKLGQLELDLHAETMDKFINLDLRGTFKTKLNDLRKHITESSHRLQNELLETRNSAEVVGDHADALRSDAQANARKIAQLEEAYATERELTAAQEASVAAEMDEMQGGINRARGEAARQATDAEATLNGARAEAQAAMEQSRAILVRLNRDIVGALGEFADLRTAVHTELLQLVRLSGEHLQAV